MSQWGKRVSLVAPAARKGIKSDPTILKDTIWCTRFYETYTSLSRLRGNYKWCVNTRLCAPLQVAQTVVNQGYCNFPVSCHYINFICVCVHVRMYIRACMCWPSQLLAALDFTLGYTETWWDPEPPQVGLRVAKDYDNSYYDYQVLFLPNINAKQSGCMCVHACACTLTPCRQK